MRIFKFNNRKYGKELLVDAGDADSFSGYFFEEEEHATDFYELIFWDAGTGHLVLDNRKISLTPGMLIFIAPLRRRKWFVNRKTLQCRFLLFRGEFISDFLKDPLFLFDLPFFYRQYPHYLLPAKEELDVLNELLKKTIRDIHLYRADSRTFLSAQLVYLLHVCRRSYLNQHDIPVADKGQNLAHRFRHLLESDLHADHGVEYYANQLQTTRVTLNKHCKNIFGINAGDLIRQRMIFEIKSGLLYTNHTINEIANVLGFNEPGNLSRFFKQLTGSAPTAYRRMYQGGLYFG